MFNKLTDITLYLIIRHSEMFYDIIYILLHSYVNMSNEMVIEQYRSQYIQSCRE